MSERKSFGAWLAERFKLVFGLDTRSLAVTRILLGLMVLLDVRMRLSDYDVFLTEGGALPREALMKYLQRREHISLYMASGADWWAYVCLAIEAAAALAFLVGYRTRIANIVVWIMVIGSHARGSILLQSGDVVLRLLLFWCMFLPMGARVSVDSVMKRIVHSPPRQVLSVATVAIQFQMAAIYVFTVLLKTGKAWRNGEAVYYALHVDHFAKQPFAGFLLEHEWMWRGLTHATFWWEMVGPWLLLVPFFFGFTRTAVVGGFIAMHLGFWAGLEIGLFPWICIAGWIVMFPGGLWEFLGWGVPPGDSKDVLTGWSWASRARTRAGTGFRYALSQAPGLFFLLLVFNWNMSTIDGKNWSVHRKVRWIGHTLRLDQKWNMFAPFPLKDDGWFVIPGKLVNGEYVDLWQGGDVKWATDEEKATWTKAKSTDDPDKENAYNLSREKPALVSAMYENQRWRKYMRNLWQKRYKNLRVYYGKHLCRSWNAEHRGTEKLRSFQMVYMKEATPKPGKTTEVVPVQIWNHDCFRPMTNDSSKTRTVPKKKLVSPPEGDGPKPLRGASGTRTLNLPGGPKKLTIIDRDLPLGENPPPPRETSPVEPPAPEAKPAEKSE